MLLPPSGLPAHIVCVCVFWASQQMCTQLGRACWTLRYPSYLDHGPWHACARAGQEGPRPASQSHCVLLSGLRRFRGLGRAGTQSAGCRRPAEQQGVLVLCQWHAGVLQSFSVAVGLMQAACQVTACSFARAAACRCLAKWCLIEVLGWRGDMRARRFISMAG